jgi:hypothetical protein
MWLPREAYLSPEVGCLFKTKERLDFLLLPNDWGIEILLEGIKVTEHLTR